MIHQIAIDSMIQKGLTQVTKDQQKQVRSMLIDMAENMEPSVPSDSSISLIEFQRDWLKTVAAEATKLADGN